MPKNTMGHRQRRQTNLFLLSKPEESRESTSARITPRQVSDEDIKSNNSVLTCASSCCLDAAVAPSKGSLKRVSPTPCLSNQVIPQTPPARLDSSESLDSPWGHFVSLSMNEDRQDESSHTTCALSTSATRRHGGVNRMPSSFARAAATSADPYPVPVKRQRVRSTSPPTTVPRLILGGTFVPRSSLTETDLLQDALMSLSV